MTRDSRRCWYGALAGLLAAAACGSPEDPSAYQVETDLAAPAAVSDLRLHSRDDSTLTLIWTSPGDDGVDGRAWRYDVRRAGQPIEEANWDAAEPIRGEPFPTWPGRSEIFILHGVKGAEIVFFALKTEDEWANFSPLSNLLRADPLDEVPPGSVDDLVARALGPLEVELTWTATGDDGGTGRAQGYVIRYAGAPFDGKTFGRGRLVNPGPIPAAAGEPENWIVTVEESEVENGSLWFALQTWDEAGHAGPLSNVARVDLIGARGGAQ